MSGARQTSLLGLWHRLPEWLRSSWWLVIFYVVFLHATPGFDWMLAYPVASVFTIGFLSFAAVGIGALQDWRNGGTMAAQIRARMTAPQSTDLGSLRGIHVILAIAALVWIAILIAAIWAANDAQRPTIIVIVGGITAFVAAPFLLFPATLALGALTRPGVVTATFTLSLEHARTDALLRRAMLGDMPPARSLGPVRMTEDATWQSEAVTLPAQFSGLGRTYRILPTDTPDTLVIEATTGSGDRETLTLATQNDRTLDAKVRIEANGLWSRAILRLAGPASLAHVAATTEAARLAHMLDTTVEPGEPVIIDD